jgi:hypothetical protein
VEAAAREIDADRRRGEFIDPDGGTQLLADWTRSWFDVLDVAPTTLAQYRSPARPHILRRWGTTALGDIIGIAVNAWARKPPERSWAWAVTTPLDLAPITVTSRAAS